MEGDALVSGNAWVFHGTLRAYGKESRAQKAVLLFSELDDSVVEPIAAKLRRELTPDPMTECATQIAESVCLEVAAILAAADAEEAEKCRESRAQRALADIEALVNARPALSGEAFIKSVRDLLGMAT